MIFEVNSVNDGERSKQTMTGSCQRLRLPSLVSVVRSPKPDCSPVRKKEQHRIVMMGAARVGKSSIISQFLYDKYLTRYRQTVEELHRGEYDYGGAALTLDILDTSGAYQFPAMRALSISTGGAFVLVFAVDEEESWKEVERLRNQITEARGFRVPIVIVGNKSDLNERKIPREITETISKIDWECGYVECSAKENTGIVDVFKELLVQAKIRYNLSPAVRRRRQSLPATAYSTNRQQPGQKMQQTAKSVMKRHSCTVA